MGMSGDMSAKVHSPRAAGFSPFLLTEWEQKDEHRTKQKGSFVSLCQMVPHEKKGVPAPNERNSLDTWPKKWCHAAILLEINALASSTFPGHFGVRCALPLLGN